MLDLSAFCTLNIHNRVFCVYLANSLKVQRNKLWLQVIYLHIQEKSLQCLNKSKHLWDDFCIHRLQIIKPERILLYMVSLILSLCGLINEPNVFNYNVSDTYFMFVLLFAICMVLQQCLVKLRIIYWNGIELQTFIALPPNHILIITMYLRHVSDDFYLPFSVYKVGLCDAK